jgi:1,4-dihydroxy-2-naphthoate octaprenyltransferase
MGLIDLKGTLRVANVLALLAFLIGLYLTSAVGTGVLAIGFAGLALGYFYTAPPLRLVARHGLGEIVIGLAFGPLITLGVFYVATAASAPELWSQFATMAFLVGIPAGLLTSNILLINQIPDTEGDAATGKAHLVVTFGYRAAVWFYALFIGGAIGVTAYLGSVLNNPYMYAVAGITTLFAAWIVSYMRKHLYARTLVKGNVATIQFQIGFSILFIVALLLG